MNIARSIVAALLIAGLASVTNAGEKAKEIKGELAANDPVDPFLQKEFKIDSPHKVHTLQVEAGKGYVIDLQGDGFDPVLRVEDPAGNTIALDDDSGGDLNSRLTVAATQTGAFRIIATTLKGTGAYTLKMQPAIVPLAERGKLAEATAAHNVKLTPGTLYVMSLTSKDFDAFLRIENSKGERVTDDDDGGIDLNSKIAFEPRKEDAYKIIVTSFDGDGRGAYDLTVVAGGAVAVPTELAGDSAQGKLTAADPRDAFQRQSPYKLFIAKMKAGTLYSIDLESNDFDPFLRLESPNREPLKEDDDSAGGLNSRITFLAQDEGDYRIIATSLIGGTGGFTLRVQPLNMKAVDEKGQLKDKTATHRFKATAGRRYVIDLISEDFDPILRLKGPDGKELAEDDDGGEDLNARIDFVARDDGMYELVVAAFDDDGRGAYRVTVRDGGAKK